MFLGNFLKSRKYEFSSVLMSTGKKYLVFADVIRKRKPCLDTGKIVQQHILSVPMFQFDLVLKYGNFLLQMSTDLIIGPNKLHSERHGKSNLNSQYFKKYF